MKMGLRRIEGRNLIQCETPPGFHASLGRAKPCTLVLRILVAAKLIVDR
jgi:hypothetical protein